MKNSRIAIGFVALLLVALTPKLARSQQLSGPIIVRTPGTNGNSDTNTKAHRQWLKAEVIHADAHEIIVREQANGMIVHTFTFAPNLSNRMQALVDNGGYQYGDKVKILHQQGNTVALKIAGKPSKPVQF